jgi:hypothetical protein
MNLQAMATEALFREYLEMNKAIFNPMFGHNAAAHQEKIAEELNARGVTEIPNPFGAIPIRRDARGFAARQSIARNSRF